MPMHDEAGNIVKWYGTAVDIEDRKRAESLFAGEKRILEMVATGGPPLKCLIAYADSWRNKPAASWRPSCCWTVIACAMVAPLAFQSPISMPSMAW